MTNFLSRYQDGNHEAVWAELVALGEAVQKEPLRAEAWAVACETMGRAKHNIGLLIPRLTELGYRFGALREDENYWKMPMTLAPPPADVRGAIEQVESLIGPMPLSLQAWFEVVGSVNLIGFHPQWPDVLTLDPLYVDGLSGSYSSILGEESGSLRDQFEEWQMNQEEEEEDIGPFVLELAPDYYHKANVSGGLPYGVALPAPVADATWEFYWKETTFVAYLRDCFRFGGLPGLEGRPDNPHLARDSSGPTAEQLEFLTRDLLPL